MSAISSLLKHIFEDTVEALKLTPWMQIWEQKWASIAVFAIFLLLLILMMIFKDRIAKNRKVLNIVAYGMLPFSFIYVGLILKAQPTTTNIVILVNGIKEGSFPLGLFIMEPYIFLSFLFIFLTILLWGRGVFCGWLCPYGAMVELLNKLYAKLFPKFSRLHINEKLHWKLIYLKYVIFAIILGVSFYNFMLSEYLAEVEPFKSFVLKLHRQWYFVLYFILITAGSVIIYRAYCRYLCPLGAALSIPSFIKLIPLIKLKRHDLCGTCKICGRECGYQAITPEGKVKVTECLNCLECQVNFWDEDRCPALIKKKRQEAKASILLPIAFILLLTPSLTYAKTLIVGTDYSAIGDALKKAKNGDVIEVKAGEYRERLKIDKAVHLKGINNPTIIENGGLIVAIASRGVTVEGFTIRDENPSSQLESAGIYISKGSDGAVIKNNRFHGVMHGVWSVGARGIRVENNIIEGKKKLDLNYRGNGITLTDSQEAVVIGNRMDYCRDGMYIEVSHDGKFIDNEMRNCRYAMHTMWVDRTVFSKNTSIGNLVGIAIMYSRQSEITDNIAVGNSTHGILLIQTTRSYIARNTVIGNTKGVYFYNSIFNNMVSNLIMNNSLGLHNWGGSEDNTVNKNSFIGNEVQVKFIAGRNQQWNNNYWSDYLGWDMNADGIGDMPFESNTVVDHILWRYPAAKLLYASPSFQFLWMLEKQFPVLKVPRVVDAKPSMLPPHKDWKELKAKYPYAPEKYYGEMEKIPVAH
ncbi:MAG: nitrous oxide reductase family maturation protein NosD [Nitrospirae bacterium]|nr:nitrous oxide reductase family maturation protein NosD [Nitrospirota bacterium]MCL5977252.1 nitrous oxide reductase family maturation protein NosD [Nitrospirota bacterium]